MNIKISIVSEIDELKKSQKDWINLFNIGDYSIFQSFEFNYYSWKIELSKNKKNKLCVLLLKNIDHSVYGIFPLYIDSNNRLRFINDNHADSCDFLSSKLIDLSEVFSYLKHHVSFRSVQLINIQNKSHSYNLVTSIHIPYKVIKSVAEYSVLNIDQGEFPYNVPHYRSHQKHRLNKALRKNSKKVSRTLNYKDDIFPREEILLLREKNVCFV